MNIHESGRRFTLTKDDFSIEFFTAGGHGGQNVQKTATACRITHAASGATGVSRDTRSQLQNRKLAFERCTASPLFKSWCAMKLREIESGESPEQWVEKQMQPQNLVVETKDGRGRWIAE